MPAPVASRALRTTGPAEAIAAHGEPVLSARDAKVHRVALTFAMIDPALQSVRISYRSRGSIEWRWPSWLAADEALRLLDELVALAASAPAVPALDRAIVDYAAGRVADLELLERAVRAWGQVEVEDPAAPSSSPTTAQLIEVFERLGRASQAVHAAVSAHDLASAPGTLLEIEHACLRAVEPLAFLPIADAPAEAERPAAGSAFEGWDDVDLGARARACANASLEYLELPDPDDYGAQLGVSIAMSMYRELSSLRRRRPYVSSASNAAQQIAYLAERAVRRRFGRARAR